MHTKEIGESMNMIKMSILLLITTLILPNHLQAKRIPGGREVSNPKRPCPTSDSDSDSEYNDSEPDNSDSEDEAARPNRQRRHRNAEREERINTTVDALVLALTDDIDVFELELQTVNNLDDTSLRNDIMRSFMVTKFKSGDGDTEYTPLLYVLDLQDDYAFDLIAPYINPDNINAGTEDLGTPRAFLRYLERLRDTNQNFIRYVRSQIAL